jgi:hypothetical protein
MEEQRLRLQEKIKEVKARTNLTNLDLMLIKNWERSLKILK